MEECCIRGEIFFGSGKKVGCAALLKPMNGLASTGGGRFRVLLTGNKKGNVKNICL